MEVLRRWRFSLWAVLATVGACTGSDKSASTDGGGSGASDATAEPSDASNGADGTFDASESGRSDGSGGTCTNRRPQLSDAEATQATVAGYLAQAGTLGSGLVTDLWDPTAGVGDVGTITPTYTVAASGGTHTTVQSAIDAASAQGGTNRIYVLVSAGTYREVVCVPPTAPPITLYSTSADATQTVIVSGGYGGEASDAGLGANPCSTAGASATIYGIAGSSTFSAFANGFQAKNITFSNDVTVATLRTTTSPQGVALMTQADKVILENVRALGHQDTLYIETPNPDTVVRAYIKNSYIAGDVDFIFGGATFVLDGCQIQFVSDRRTTGQVLAPSTDSRDPYGILVIGSTFTADANLTGTVGLGRAWDHNCADIPTYVSTCVAAGHYPNGQAVIRNSTLGTHVASVPWVAAATSKRPYCNTAWACVADAGSEACPANRLDEYQNTGPGNAH
jgi:pectinesterase